MTDLMRVCRQADTLWLKFTNETLSIVDEEAYALRLVDLGERLFSHARSRQGQVIDGEPTRLVIDAEPVRVEYCKRALPPGSQSDDGGS